MQLLPDWAVLARTCSYNSREDAQVLPLLPDN